MAINRHLLHWSRTIHVYLSIALLIILIFFAITGITLNNASTISGTPAVSTLTIDGLPDLPRDAENRIIPSPEFIDYLHNEFDIHLDLATLTYEDEFLVIDYQTPGKAMIIEIDQEYGEVFVEKTNFGVIAMLNDLHKGRHVDILLSWFIDFSGVILIIFSLAGFILLLPNKRRLKKVAGYSFIGIIILFLGYYLGNL